MTCTRRTSAICRQSEAEKPNRTKLTSDALIASRPIHAELGARVRTQIPSFDADRRSALIVHLQNVGRFGKRDLTRDLLPFPRVPDDLRRVCRESVGGGCGGPYWVGVAVGRAGGHQGEGGRLDAAIS